MQNLEVNKALIQRIRVFYLLIPILSSLLEKMYDFVWLFKKYAHICTDISTRYLRSNRIKIKHLDLPQIVLQNQVLVYLLHQFSYFGKASNKFRHSDRRMSHRFGDNTRMNFAIIRSCSPGMAGGVRAQPVFESQCLS